VPVSYALDVIRRAQAAIYGDHPDLRAAREVQP
jgi:hypothetical protein